MRRLLPCAAAGFALLIGCADHERLPTDQGASPHAQSPAFDRAEVGYVNFAFAVAEPGKPLFVMVNFLPDVTLADLCSGQLPEESSSLAHIVLPSGGGFLAAAHAQDVPVLVYQVEGDLCDGVGESLLASGTGQFHFSGNQVRNGTAVQHSGVRATLDLVAGGQALLVVQGAFHQLPDGSVLFDKTRIALTPL